MVSVRWVNPSRVAWSRIRSAVNVLTSLLRVGEVGVVDEGSGGNGQVGMPSGQQRRQRLDGPRPGRLDNLTNRGRGPGVAIGQPVPVRLVDHPRSAGHGPRVGGQPTATVHAEGVDAYWSPPAGSGWICSW